MRASRIPYALALCAISVVSCQVALAQSATYNFTGTVTQTEGSYTTIANGTAVTGTITYDPGDATGGSVSGGSVTSSALPFVFSDTVVVGGFSFSSNNPAPTFSAASHILYNNGGTGGGSQAHEQADFSTGGNTASDFNFAPLSGLSAYTADGLLNPGGISFSGTSTNGDFNTNTSLLAAAGEVSFAITSITPAVPLPPSSILLLTGMSFLGLLLYRRRGQSTPHIAA
jgi:hypothetical protein